MKNRASYLTTSAKLLMTSVNVSYPSFIRTVDLHSPEVEAYCDIAHELRIVQHQRSHLSQHPRNDASFEVLLNYLVEVEDSIHPAEHFEAESGRGRIEFLRRSQHNIWIVHMEESEAIGVLAMLTFSLYVPIDVLVAALERLCTYSEIMHVDIVEGAEASREVKRSRAVLTGRGVIKCLMILYSYLSASFVEEMIRVSRLCVWKFQGESSC